MKRTFIADGYYHIYNRGALKADIFRDQRDYARFLFLLLGYQSLSTFSKISRILAKHKISDIQNALTLFKSEDVKKPVVEILSFCLMPNHFHIIVHELQENGVSQFMHKLLNAYGKYFNKKYQRDGHIFQGPYKCKHILDDNQLMYTSAYIHHNPKELKLWSKEPEKYSWSSYYDYVIENRWGNFLQTNIILDFHSSQNEYKNFVFSSGAKEDFRDEIYWQAPGAGQKGAGQKADVIQ